MPTYALVNEKMLQVTLAGEKVYSRKGSMVAYKGRVLFERSFLGPEGIQSLAMRQVTNEGLSLMAATGQGDVFYARDGLFVTLVPLDGSTLYVESKRVLAFDSRLQAGTMFLGNQGLQGLVRGAATGSGLFTTTLEGRGEVALTSHGECIELAVTASNPISVDPQAYIAHRGQLSSKLVTDMSWKTFLGQGSGESFQLRFEGTGSLYIQASERAG